MSKIRCNICGKHILQREEIVRVVCEKVKKQKGDPCDPLYWSYVIDWSESFVAHAICTEEDITRRKNIVPMPCEVELQRLFEPSEECHLSVLDGGCCEAAEEADAGSMDLEP